MAYNVDNWGVIQGNGIPIRVGFILNGGQGLGSQWAEGAPQDGGNTLITTNAGISLGDDRKFGYQFDLTCFGRGCSYGLHGGGQT
jgi:hypothetical protein